MIVTSREFGAFEIDIGIGVVGFILSLLLGRTTGMKMTNTKVRVLAAVWTGIAIFGMLAVFVMRHVP